MRLDQYEVETSRLGQIVAGCVLAPLSLFPILLAVGLIGMAESGEVAWLDVLPFAAVSGVFGGWALHLSWRLISGRRRLRDGGLVSPAALVLCGVGFLAAAVAGFYVSRTFWNPFFCLASAVSCWTLAWRRTREGGLPRSPAA